MTCKSQNTCKCKPNKKVFYLILYIYFLLTNMNTETLLSKLRFKNLSCQMQKNYATLNFSLTAKLLIKIICTYAVYVKKWRKLLNDDLLVLTYLIYVYKMLQMVSKISWILYVLSGRWSLSLGLSFFARSLIWSRKNPLDSDF